VEFDVDLVKPRFVDPDADVRVTQRSGKWALERGDFTAEWEPARRTGRIRQFANPYSIDAVLRIVHTLVLAQEGGFLMHAASAIRNGKAFLFAGVSGAGKTTISRLAPSDVTLLTDEISYVRKYVRQGVLQRAEERLPKQDHGYVAYGTPFTGELAKLGENVSAPISTLYLLSQGLENRIDPIAPGQAVRELLANVLFFAEDQELVQRAFHAACEFVSRVPVSRLTFVPDARVWEMIG
jgi:ATPase subunit of ABC transporter with duplicated ATPase domains